MNKKLSSPCPKCKGTGQLALPEHLTETYGIIKKHGPLTVVQIRAKIATVISITGVGQRVTDLINAGLVSGKKNGRAREFSVVTKTKRKQ